MPFTFRETKIKGVIRIETEVFLDERGCLCEAYEADEFRKASIVNDFELDLVSKSERNVLRGLHFQRSPYQQAKLIRCISGKIFDVAVDLRADSKTYGEYITAYLCGDKNDGLFIPRGFAHGYLSLDQDTIVTYKLDKKYNPEYTSGINWTDPVLGIDWPLSKTPIISQDDETLPTLMENEHVPLEGE